MIWLVIIAYSAILVAIGYLGRMVEESREHHAAAYPVRPRSVPEPPRVLPVRRGAVFDWESSGEGWLG